MLLLYIEIIKEPTFDFHKPSLDTLKNTFPKLDTLDLDNHSENYLFDYALSAFQQESQGILYFHIKDTEAQLGKSILLLNKLIKKKQQMLIFLEGNHLMLEKMMKIYPNVYINVDNSEIEQKINEFSNNKNHD